MSVALIFQLFSHKYWLLQVIENDCIVTCVGVYTEILPEPSGNISSSTPPLFTIQLHFNEHKESLIFPFAMQIFLLSAGSKSYVWVQRMLRAILLLLLIYDKFPHFWVHHSVDTYYKIVETIQTANTFLCWGYNICEIVGFILLQYHRTKKILVMCNIWRKKEE